MGGGLFSIFTTVGLAINPVTRFLKNDYRGSMTEFILSTPFYHIKRELYHIQL